MNNRRNSRLVKPFAIAAWLLAGTAAAHAQMSLQAPPGQADGWSLRLGASVLSLPKYPGADDSRTLLIPDFEARYRDWFFADTLRGLGVMARPAEGLELRASIGLTPDRRRRKDAPRLVGFEDIDDPLALNLGLSYTLGPVFIESGIRNRLASSGQRGVSVETQLGFNLVDTARTRLGLGVVATVVDSDYARTFYSVTAAQAAASGLRRYDAGSGVNQAGVFAQLQQGLSEHWLLAASVQTTRLRGDAAASPITQNKRQTQAVVSVLYTF